MLQAAGFKGFQQLASATALATSPVAVAGVAGDIFGAGLLTGQPNERYLLFQGTGKQ